MGILYPAKQEINRCLKIILCILLSLLMPVSLQRCELTHFGMWVWKEQYWLNKFDYFLNTHSKLYISSSMWNHYLSDVYSRQWKDLTALRFIKEVLSANGVGKHDTRTERELSLKSLSFWVKVKIGSGLIWYFSSLSLQRFIRTNFE